MTVAYEERAQENEHSCFSDNTIADIVANARGIQNVYLGTYGNVKGPGLKDLVAARDRAVADQLGQEIEQSVKLAQAIPGPFDKSLREGLPDSDPGRRAIRSTIESLETQTESIVKAAQSVGIPIRVS
jgi:putative iron-regulated protein